MANYDTRDIGQEASTALDKLSLKANETNDKAKDGVQVNPDGTISVVFSDDPETNDDQGLGAYANEGHYANLVDKLTPDERQKLAMQVNSNVSSDEMSRDDWMRTIEFGFDLLGVKVEEKNFPFEGACSAQHPLLMESAVKFQSKASNELLPANGPVKVKVLGDVTLEKEDQANRVKDHMNYQIVEQMTEFYTDTERMLLYVALVGSGFKKTYYNSHLERPCSEFVPADQLIVPNSSSDLYRADRYTHLLYKTEYDLEADFAAGLYSKPSDNLLGSPSDLKITAVQKKTQQLLGTEVSIGDRDKGYTLYEQHISLCIDSLDDDKSTAQKKYKVARPYIVTVDSKSQQVLGLRRNWKEGDSKYKKKVPFSHFMLVPSFNFYGYGFLHLLGNLQLTLTACMRSLVDAGQFANLQGGFKLKGVRIVDDGSPIHPGQFKEIETAIMDVNKAIMPLPFKEPSNVLYQMLNFIDAKGQKFADSTDQVLSDATNYGPVGTTMALLEASNKFFSAIHKRLHASLKNELKIIADINSETLPDDLEYNIENETKKVSRQDYDDRVDVVPVSDPNISSSAHRMAKAQTLYEFAMRAPELHDMREVLKHVYTNMDYANIDKILPAPEEAKQNDPMTDIQMAVQGKPIKAFEGQDHKSHIALKQAFLQDPSSGANPLMQKASITIQGNIQEHMLLSFMEQTKAPASMNGQQQQGQEVDPNQAMAQAAAQIAQMNQQHLQQQLEQQKQSPKDQAALMLAQAEMKDTEHQGIKIQLDHQHKMGQLAVQQEKVHVDKIKEMNKAAMHQQDIKAVHDEIVTTKGLDAMIQGMSQSYEAKQKKEQYFHDMQHKASMAKEAKKPVIKPVKGK